MKRFNITGPLFITMLFFACRSGHTKSGEEQDIDLPKDSVAAATTTTLTAIQMKTIGLEFGPVERKELTNTVKTTGVLTVPNQNKAYVTPLYGGVIRSLSIQPGNWVREGQPVATIVNPELLQMQQQYQQLAALVAMAETEAKRQKELVAGNAAPLKKLQQAETELGTLTAQRDAITQQLVSVGASFNFSSSIVVKAPIAGTVSKVMAQLGSNVDVTTPIAEIVDNSLLHLDLHVYEKDLPRLRAGQTIHFTLTNNPGGEYDALIYSIGTAFENDSKTIPVHARVMGDKNGLIDGMSITALVSLDKSTVPTVPAEAIVNYQGRDYVFLAMNADSGMNSGSSETKFERIPVAKGVTDVGFTEITPLKDIPANAKIVTRGAFFILAKMTNGEQEAD